MANLQSPGIQIIEIDATTIVPSVATTEMAFAGQFQWGPLNTPLLMDTEATLYNSLQGPNNSNFQDWFMVANALSYGDFCWTVRVGHESDANTSALIKNATAANSNGFLIKNNQDYVNNYSNGQLKSNFDCGDWVAKYPGALGNSLKVSVCTSANTYSSSLTGTVNVTANTKTVTGVGTDFVSEVSIGDILVINGESQKVAAVANTTQLTLVNNHLLGATSANTATRYWEYFTSVNIAPGTSAKGVNLGAEDDEMHIVVIDEDGLWTGQKGEILEVFQFVSQGIDATNDDGTSNYYVTVINTKSNYIKWSGHPDALTNVGKTLSNQTFTGVNKPMNYSLVGGNDGKKVTDADKIRGYNQFLNKELIQVDIVIGGIATQTLTTWLINNLIEMRKDCVGFFSPPQATVVNNAGSELTSIVNYRNLLPSSSYAALDCNWKYQYDRYNDRNRWLPCNGDIAGIHVASDEARDAWWAAAGLNRGQLKNVIQLAWNPTNSQRDVLYQNGINPIVTFPGKGTYLWGQKTLLSKPSAFDRLNVRRLFLVLERSIEQAAQYFLFEFNDAITRAQFVNTVEPFLRNVQGRRGIYDFKVVCDDTNNTPFVIDSNQFIAEIYIKPTRVAEFMTLRFIATPTGIDFSTIVGKF